METNSHSFFQQLGLKEMLACARTSVRRRGTISASTFFSYPMDGSGPLVGVMLVGILIGVLLVVSYQRYQQRSKKRMLPNDAFIGPVAPPAPEASAVDQLQHTPVQAEFLAMLSHEIRTPLNTILGMVELPLRNIRLPKESRHHLSQALQAIEALQNVLDNILDLSRIQVGKTAFEVVSIELQPLLDNIAKLYRVVSNQKGLHFNYEIALQDIPPLTLSAGKLRQILNNLLSNAVKFTSQGSVSLNARSFPVEDDKVPVEISISDTGIGISEHEISRLFEPFTQASEQIQRRYGGTGLGLYISRKLTHLIGGSLEITSKPGLGTCITLHFNFPIAQSDATNLKFSEPSPENLPFISPTFATGLHALIVEDSDSNRYLLSRQLERMGFNVTEASSGNEAAQRWRPGQYNIILVDYHMPGLSGPEFIRHIRAAETQCYAHCQIKGSVVIGLSADTEPESENSFIEAGASICLNKPVRYGSLYSAIKTLLGEAVMSSGETSFHWLDSCKLKDLSDNNSEFEKTFLRSVQDNNRLDIEEAKEAYIAQDNTRLFQALHRLSGVLQLICEQDLATQLAALNKAVKNAQQETVDSLFEDMLDKLHKLDEEITKYLNVYEKQEQPILDN